MTPFVFQHFLLRPVELAKHFQSALCAAMQLETPDQPIPERRVLTQCEQVLSPSCSAEALQAGI
jgi:hypothetical protein